MERPTVDIGVHRRNLMPDANHYQRTLSDIGGRLRISIATIMMFVVMAAAAMALFAKIQHLADDAAVPTGWKLDAPILFLLAIFLTSVALGSWKEHTGVQIMIQVTLA